MRTQSGATGIEKTGTANTINRRIVAEFMSRLSREMEDIADALLEKGKPVEGEAAASVLLRSSWITSGVFGLTNMWDSPVKLDNTNLIFLKSTWITAGAEPRCN
jgi:hypothetical protein